MCHRWCLSHLRYIIWNNKLGLSNICIWRGVMTSFQRLHIDTRCKVLKAATSRSGSQESLYFHIALKFITIFTKRPFASPWASWIHSTSSLPISLRCIYYYFSAECRCQVNNTPASYSGGPGFQSQRRYRWIIWVRILAIFLSPYKYWDSTSNWASAASFHVLFSPLTILCLLPPH
jgi:hypothetical protein